MLGTDQSPDHLFLDHSLCVTVALNLIFWCSFCYLNGVIILQESLMYSAPTDDMSFVLRHIVKMDELTQFPKYQEASQDLVDAVLDEARKLSSDVWAPTNEAGDQETAKLVEGNVVTPTGFKEAYTQFSEGGWNSLSCNEEFGGQDLPWSLSMAVNEMWQSANLALSLCPLLTAAAIEAIEQHGTQEQKEMYLPKLISGEWTGTMNLTEPQAGTDLAAIKSIAEKDGSGDFYRLRGQKIFITFGDHNFTDNIIHLVLARVAGLPEGNAGLGLFIVPKFLVNEDGSLGQRNDAGPVSLEHKLGIHGSPTCVMQYGDDDGAMAYIVGEEGAGLKNMFTMMNNARITVGLQGVALCERAYQHALSYAKERVQGFALGNKGGDRVAIIEHPDVRRMLMTMRAYTEAARAMAYYAGGMNDRAKEGKDTGAKKRVDLLTPLVKAWCTDLSVEVASIGVQIHGGMGFIEETGAAQHYRDARILPIYEGANGIHGLDLVFRKLLMDGGAEAKRFLDEMKEQSQKLLGHANDDLDVIQGEMLKALTGLEKTTGWMLDNAKSNTNDLAAASVLYLKQYATIVAGHFMAQSALAAHQHKDENKDFAEMKLLTARFYAEALLPQVAGLMTPIMGGHSVLAQVTNDQF